MIALCPNCFNKVSTDVFTQREDLPCFMCGGRGFIDNEHVCRCGRPAIRVSGNVETCANEKCVEKALGIQNGTVSQTEFNPSMNWEDMDDKERYDHWFNMRGY
jgi:hypothetical protein